MPIMTTCKNTFIHAVEVEPHPALQTRSKSVPKNLGSCKMICEEPDDSDESTNLGSGVPSPAVTASPCWTPRDSFECGWEWTWPTEEGCMSRNFFSQTCVWADVPVDVCPTLCEQSFQECTTCADVSAPAGSHHAGPRESSDRANRCVLCLSQFI
jgi:hypothetical protein